MPESDSGKHPNSTGLQVQKTTRFQRLLFFEFVRMSFGSVEAILRKQFERQCRATVNLILAFFLQVTAGGQ